MAPRPAPPLVVAVALMGVGVCASGSMLADYAVVERGPHHRTWEQLETFVDEAGNAQEVVSRYVELETGMHFWDKAGQQWQESRALIEQYPNGAIAQFGPQRVIFSNNLNTEGSIDISVGPTPQGGGQRLRATLEDGSAWSYDYNDRNELVIGKRTWSDHAPVTGQQFEYAFDNAGNRSSAKTGGDEDGLNLRSTSYTADNLNQYSSITTPGYEDILGLAWATSTVKVDNVTTDRNGEYFHREISLSNGSGPVWQNVSVTAGASSDSGNVLFPPNSQSPTYDDDDNLTQDGLWSYTWDAENRLIAVESRTTVASAGRRKVEFTYDHLGRRSTKKSYTHNGSNYVLQDDLLLVHDGWNLVAELNASNKNTIRSYVWGLDLAQAEPGDLQGTGGVGGLLMVWDHTGASPVCHFATFDGNGNLTGLVEDDGSVSARYEYGPFGEPVRVSGAFAAENPFRWSTKYWDVETDLSYFGRRYYSPSLGRWISRDPIEEAGGINLYNVVLNDPVNFFDIIGNIRYERDSGPRGGFHVHDGDLTFGVNFNDRGGFEVFSRGGSHAGQFNEKAAVKSMKRILQNPKELHRMRYAFANAGPGPGTAGDWERLSPDARDLRSAEGRNIWRAAKKAGKALGAVVVVNAIASSMAMADVAESYGRNLKRGDTAMADLDAIDLASGIMGATDNYFMGYIALDLLLTD